MGFFSDVAATSWGVENAFRRMERRQRRAEQARAAEQQHQENVQRMALNRDECDRQAQEAARRGRQDLSDWWWQRRMYWDDQLNHALYPKWRGRR